MPARIRLRRLGQDTTGAGWGAPARRRCRRGRQGPGGAGVLPRAPGVGCQVQRMMREVVAVQVRVAVSLAGSGSVGVLVVRVAVAW
ncbi:hypothetical protein SSCG_01933 [Streptomyces clavuligerus]|nr:hypothetical protein SSCG_01933 [Streptomyces clavuligerus]